MPADVTPDRTAAWLDGLKRARARAPRTMRSLDEVVARMRVSHPSVSLETLRVMAARATRVVDEGSVGRQMGLAGAGIGYFIEDGLADDIAAGRLVRLLSDWTPKRAGLCLYYPGRRNPSAGVAAFLALVRQRS